MSKVIATFLLVLFSLGLVTPVWADDPPATGDFSFLEQVQKSNPTAETGPLFVGNTSRIEEGKPDTEAISFIANLVQYAIIVLSVFLLLYLIIGAYHYVIAGGDEEKAKKAKATIVQAIIGFLIAILSYSIINIVAKTPEKLAEFTNQEAPPAE